MFPVCSAATSCPRFKSVTPFDCAQYVWSFCTYVHLTGFAKKDGANDEEIKAAIQIAAEIQRFSTLLYGNEFDVDTFNKIIGRDNKE